MNTTEVIDILEHKGIKPTANRILVARALAESSTPLSLLDITESLPSMDKSSVFRVLSLFLEHDVVHSFEDGRGVINYEMCRSDGECDRHDNHVHFYCEICHRSYCMEDLSLPKLVLPEGFTMHSLSFVIKGLCPKCKSKPE